MILKPEGGDGAHAGARRGKIQKIVCHGFYSRGLTSFAGKGGFAADLGRFGETTLPFFSMGADRAAPLSFSPRLCAFV